MRNCNTLTQELRIRNAIPLVRIFVEWPPDPKLITDTQHSTLRIHTPHSGFTLHTQDSHSTLRIHTPHSGFTLHTQDLHFTLRIYTPHSGFTLHTQDSHSTLRIHTPHPGFAIQIHEAECWVSSVECWVTIISLGPDLIQFDRGPFKTHLQKV